jgi:hypothetical protein
VSLIHGIQLKSHKKAKTQRNSINSDGIAV